MEQFGGIIWDVTKYLCGCAKEKAVYIYNLEENLQSLKDKWEDLRSMKEDLKTRVDEAESTGERERTREVNRWLNHVEHIQKAIEDIQVEGAQEIQNYCLSKCCPKNCISSYKLGKNVAKMLENVDEISTRGKIFSSKDVDITRKLLGRSIKILSNEILGLDLMLDKVWSSIEAENVGVIGFYGMGGVGKTTLLKKINNELGKRRPDFSIVMWVEVTREPNLDRIMDNIRKLVGIGDDIWNPWSNQDEKVGMIYQVLKKKKFVLLLDDIWERLDLSLVGVPHPKDTNFQSKVLFTTRFEDVCAKMKAQEKFKIEILNEEEAFNLFCMNVGEETLESHPSIPNLAREMAAKCKGLPLALIVVGNAMAGMKNMKVWKHSKSDLTNSPLIASDLEKNVFSILKFSYERLPDETHKKCFLYCALYPEDYEILVPDLIDKWIGEGFLGKDTTKSILDMRDHGESVIEKLKLSCLLESVEDHLSLTHVRMHTMIREMALWLSRDENKNRKKILVQGDALAMSQDDIETWKIVERISIIRHGESYLPNAVCPNLITLMFASTGLAKKTVVLSNIKSMSRLKVLDLSFGITTIIELTAEIGSLVLLEYLSLNGQMRPSKFPIELKNLTKLKFFGLTNLYLGDLISIPFEVISSLNQLRVLRFTTNAKKKSEEETEFLDELESLPHLEELWIQIKTDNGLNKLLDSIKLQSCIWNLYLEDMDTLINMPSLLAAMSMMKHLQQIWFLHLNVEDSSVFDRCRLKALRTVTISKCHSIFHLTWLKYARHLHNLDIEDCSSMEEVIEEGMEDDKDRENVDYTFSSLVELHLWILPNLKSIHKTALSFPSLRFIEILECPNLKKLPFDSSSAKDKLRHIRGDQQWWDNLEWEDPAIKDTFLSKFQA